MKNITLAIVAGFIYFTEAPIIGYIKGFLESVTDRSADYAQVDRWH